MGHLYTTFGDKLRTCPSHRSPCAMIEHQWGGLQSHLRPIISILLECIVLLKCNCTIEHGLISMQQEQQVKISYRAQKSFCTFFSSVFFFFVFACCWKISIPSAPNASIRHAATYQPLELCLYLTMHIINFTLNSFHSHCGFGQPSLCL